MAQLVISAAGAAVGFAVGGPVGAQVGWALGSVVGAQFGPKQRTQGPRLEDLKITGAEYGQPIPWVAGHPRVAAQVWWASNKREISTTTTQGKGGGAVSTTYTYECDILYGLCDVEIDGIRRIWSNGALIWSAHADADVQSLTDSGEFASWSRLTVYTGAASQLPDPTYEAAVTNAPAYRGRGTVFIEGLQLGNSGVIPNLTFEVIVSGHEYLATPTDGPEVSTPRDLAHGCPASDSAEFIVPIGQWTNSYETTLTYVYRIDVFAEQPELIGSFNAQISVPSATGTSNIPLLVLCSGTTAYAHKQDGSFASFTLPANLGNAQARFARTDDAIVFGSSLFGGQLLHRFSPSGGSALASSATLPQYVNSILIVGDTVYAAAKDIKQIFVLDLETLTLQQTINTPVYSSGSSDSWPILFLLHGNVTLISSLPSGGNYPVYMLVGASWVDIGGIPTGSGYVQSSDLRQTVCAIGNVVISGLGTDAPYKYVTWWAPLSLEPDTTTLQAVVEALCERAGMPAGTYDASALASITKPVRALAVSQVTNARAVLEQLMSAYFFEGYCTDKLYFVPRGGSSVDTIDADYMGAEIA
jgi:hypothetical protein